MYKATGLNGLKSLNIKINRGCGGVERLFEVAINPNTLIRRAERIRDRDTTNVVEKSQPPEIIDKFEAPPIIEKRKRSEAQDADSKTSAWAVARGQDTPTGRGKMSQIERAGLGGKLRKSARMCIKHSNGAASRGNVELTGVRMNTYFISLVISICYVLAF
jgi:hypothetical protein